MTTTLLPLPKARFFNASGAPLVGGKVYSYAAGTTTPKATYTDSTGNSANANPVILDSAGEADIWLSGNYKIVLKDSNDVEQWTVDNVSGLPTDLPQWLSVTGTDTIIATPMTAISGYAAQQTFLFIAAGTNTTAVTINISGIGTKSITKNGSAALIAGDIVSGMICQISYDGTEFQLANPSGANKGATTFTGTLRMSGAAINEAAYVTVASATSTPIGAAASNNVAVSGTTTITSFDTVAAGITRRVRFTGILLLTYNATSLILPTAASITTAVNDTATFTSLGAGNWLCIEYLRANGYAAGSYIQSQRFTIAGTSSYTATAGTNSVEVEVIGGGASGATSNGTGICPGGSAGGYTSKRITSGFSGTTVTVGGGGAGVTTNTAGNNGGTSSFGAFCSASGGIGGSNASTNSASAGGTATGGDINLAGGYGMGIDGASKNLSMGGAAPMYGTVSIIVNNGSSISGIAGRNPGDGGTGASSGGTSGAGHDGAVYVHEYA